METLYLTRRNITTLLNKLNRNVMEGKPVSKCTIMKTDTVHPKYPMKRVTAIVALENAEYYIDRAPGMMLPDDDPPDAPRDILEEVIDKLSGPEVWGALNHGSMQCSQCQTAMTGLEDQIAELKKLLPK